MARFIFSKDWNKKSEITIIFVDKNSGICTDQEGTQNFTCDCSEPYIGRKCETHLCETINCVNNGTCSVEIIDAVSVPLCVCSNRYQGDYCENDLCDEINCINGNCSIIITRVLQKIKFYKVEK